MIRIHFIVVSMLFAAAASAQREIGVKITVPACQAFAGKTITAVVNGDDSNPISLTRTGDDLIGKTTDTRKIKFPDVPAVASLRLHGARTYCRTSSKPEKSYLGTDVAVFHFACDEQEVQQVRVDTNPTAPVSYVRWLPKSPVPDKFGHDCECNEGGVFPRVGTISDVLFPSELLLLQIGRGTPDPRIPGLLVNDLTVIPHAEFGGSAHLTRIQVLTALFVQRIREPRPDFVPLAIDIDDIYLPKALDLRVKVTK